MEMRAWVGAVALAIACGSAACARTTATTTKAPGGPLETAEAALAIHDCGAARLEARKAMAHAKVARALVVLGACDELEGNVQDAVVLYQDALAVDPRSIDASKRLAGILLDVGEIEQAIAVAHRALERAPGDGDLWLIVAIAWERKGDDARATAAFARAAETFRIAAKRHLDDAPFRMRHARVLIAIGDVDAARVELEAVVDLARDHVELVAEAALAFSSIGEPKRCVSALDEALESFSTSDAAHRALLLSDRATCRYAAKDLGGARADADASLALEPSVELHLKAARWDEQAGDKRGCTNHYLAAATLAAGTPIEHQAELGAQRCSS